MKALKYKVIDGYKVAVSLSDILIDPVATNKKTNKEMKKNSTGKNLVSKLKEFRDKVKEYNRKKHKVSNTEISTLKNEIAIIKNQVKDLKKEYKKEFKTLFRNDPVYFGLGKNEIVITKDQQKEIKKLNKELENEVICLDKNNSFIKVKDFKNTTYYLENNDGIRKHRIDNLGEDLPENAIITLSEEQQKEFNETLEKERISGLTADEKEAEKTKRLNNLSSIYASQIAVKELEGLTHEEAVNVVKAEMEIEKQRIEGLYA